MCPRPSSRQHSSTPLSAVSSTPSPSASHSRWIRLDERVLAPYRRFSLYNSPYAAHDAGCAIDLYPAGSDPETGASVAPSPVAGTVLETKRVRAPSKPYACDYDYLILLDVEAPASAAGLVARILHVDPQVTAGDRVSIGDPLGTLIRAGFFAPWVGTHLHLGFRPRDRDPYRASGSLPITLGVDLDGWQWDGTGTVVRTGKTFVVLDAPTAGESPTESDATEAGDAHGNGGAPETRDAPADWVGLATDAPTGRVLDGGMSHYDYGGVLGGSVMANEPTPVVLCGTRVGVATGRTVEWDAVTVQANGEPVTGLSLYCGRPGSLGIKVVVSEHEFEPGDPVVVTVDRH